MSNAYLKNAFRMLDALNEDIFDISDEGISQLADTLNVKDDTVSIIDPEAESEEDIQDSYMDKVILECEVCHSLIYKNKDEIKIDDESQLANIDEECPYCFSTNGYKIVGQVAPFEEKSDEEDIEVEVDGEDVDIESEEDDEDLDESLKEGFNDVQISTDDQHLTMTQNSETGKVTVETEPIQKEESLEDDEMMIDPLNDEEEQEIEDNSDQLKAEESEEELEEVPENETSEESEDKESEDEESEDVDISDFEESLFNDLGQKYLTEVYDNIESFNTSKVYQDNKNNKLIIEGVIKFNSGNSKKTSFIFEAKDIDKDRRVRFVGENQQITKGKKSFTLRGTLKDGNLLSESLTYNYRTRDNDGESIRLYNTIKVGK